MDNQIKFNPLVQRANWSPRLHKDKIGGDTETKPTTHLTTSEPGMGTALIHLPAVFRTCRASTSSCCHKIVKHCGGYQHSSEFRPFRPKGKNLVAASVPRLAQRLFLILGISHTQCGNRCQLRGHQLCPFEADNIASA